MKTLEEEERELEATYMNRCAILGEYTYKIHVLTAEAAKLHKELKVLNQTAAKLQEKKRKSESTKTAVAPASVA